MVKGCRVKEVMNFSGFNPIVAIGDGMNDVQMFEHSHISVAFGRVHKSVESLIKVSKSS